MIGVDLSDKSIKIAHLANDGSHKLISHGVEHLDDGAMENGMVLRPKEVIEALQKLWQRCHLATDSKDAVIASIPEAQSFLRVIEIPAMHEDEVGEAVQWEVAQHIPFGLENVYIDWQSLSPGHRAIPGRLEVQVGAAQKKVVDALYGVLSALHLDVAAFELESQALVRALISRELRDRQGLLIVDLGASATNVVIHDHGAMRFTASLQKGAQNLQNTLPEHVARAVDTHVHEVGGTASAPADLVAALQPAIEELVVEVRGIVEFYNSIDEQHEVQEIIITGGGSNLPGLDKVFLKYFDSVHVQRGNPWVNILSTQKNLKAPLDVKESVRYTTALGLALRPALL